MPGPNGTGSGASDSPSTGASGTNDAEISKIEEVLTGVFGHSSLRPGQGPVIRDVLGGRRVLAVMPTGSGKSLCYQLPAVMLAKTGGITLVVSPLIALMKDQVDALGELGVRAEALTSAEGYARQTEILDDLRQGKLHILYVAPERFRSGRFISALESVADKLAIFAIDEAHCISEWGHDFRPAYRVLGEAIERLKPPRVIALTATATPEVRVDIAEQLGLEAQGVHVHGFARPNLTLSMVAASRRRDKEKKLVELVRMRAGGTALVYAATRKNTERYAGALSEAGMSVGVYHAGLSDHDRGRCQDAFMDGQLDAIVATNAFGMGVDKADIRLVAHADIPRSPEAYYQEAGRGGRDGAPSDCVLLFHQGDVRLHEFLIDMSYPSPELLRGIWKLLRSQPGLGASAEVMARDLPGDYTANQVTSASRLLAKHGLLSYDGQVMVAVKPSGDYPPLDPEGLQKRANVERAKLRRMISFAYTTSCRHRFLLNYFGDQEQPPVCRACDNCQQRGQARLADDRERSAMRELLSVLSRRSGNLGRKKIAAAALDGGDGAAGFSATQLVNLLDAMEGAQLIASSSGHYPTISITASGREALAGALPAIHVMKTSSVKKARLSSRTGPSATEKAALESPKGESLRGMRTELARENAVPPYVILSNRTIVAIVEAAPSTLEELGRVSGIGPAKLTSYGEQILAALK